jgi:hypothetical protein
VETLLLTIVQKVIKKLNKSLQSFNLSSIAVFPTRISLNSFSTIDNFFIDDSYINKFDIIPLMNGLSDHDPSGHTVKSVGLWPLPYWN